MTLIHAMIWGSWIIFGVTTVWGLAWAIRTGQFQRLDEGARSIFDEEEPIGQVTDAFPGTEPEVLDQLDAADTISGQEDGYVD